VYLRQVQSSEPQLKCSSQNACSVTSWARLGPSFALSLPRGRHLFAALLASRTLSVALRFALCSVPTLEGQCSASAVGDRQWRGPPSCPGEQGCHRKPCADRSELNWLCCGVAIVVLAEACPVIWEAQYAWRHHAGGGILRIQVDGDVAAFLPKSTDFTPVLSLFHWCNAEGQNYCGLCCCDPVTSAF
jgi:hypothetical protein